MNEYEKNELYHDGIKGMKWGVRNGPPYPLRRSDMSAAEKKASGGKSSGSGSSSSGRLKIGKTAKLDFRGHRAAEKQRHLRITNARLERAQAKGKENKSARLEKKVDKIQRNLSKYEAKTKAIIDNYKAQGYKINSKQVDRLGNIGQAWVLGALSNPALALPYAYFTGIYLPKQNSPYSAFVKGKTYRVRR